METTNKIIEASLIDYLKTKDIKIVENRAFKCPLHHEHSHIKENTATLSSNLTKIYCADPKHGDLGNIYDIVRKLEPNFTNLSNEDIVDYLVHLLNIKLDERVDNLLALYSDAGFCLFPLRKQGQGKTSKMPIQKEWEKSENRNINEWKEWLKADCGLALNLGKKSNVIAIDIDDEETYTKVQHLLGNTLIQSTKRGKHYLYSYDEEFDTIKHVNLRDKGYAMEVRANNSYIVIAPTTVEGEYRDWNYQKIQPFPVELKTFLLTLIEKRNEPTDLGKDDDLGNYKLNGLDGACNETFIKVAGVLRKKLNVEQTEYALFTLNKILKDPMPNNSIKGMIRQVEKYSLFDKDEMSKQILSHLEVVEQATSRDLKDSLRYEKKDIEECLFHLLKEKKIFKIRNTYKLLKRADWKETFIEEARLLDFKVPYFDHVATFRQSDMLIIGAQTGVGKTSIAVNILKKLVDQGIKPCYISSEPGNRFTTMAMTLGLEEGQFKWTNHYRPETIELEDNAVTIIDWLLPEDYAQVDKLYQKFAEQLDKHKGFLIVFTQLKKGDAFFSANMVDLFASVVASYKHINGDNLNTCFETHKIRESKQGKQKITIPTVYHYKTKTLELRES